MTDVLQLIDVNAGGLHGDFCPRKQIILQLGANTYQTKNVALKLPISFTKGYFARFQGHISSPPGSKTLFDCLFAFFFVPWGLWVTGALQLF